MLFRFKELNELFRSEEIKFLDLLFDLKIDDCKRSFKDLLFFYLLSEIHKELNKNKDVIFYINLDDPRTYNGLEFYDSELFINALDSVYKKIIRLMPNKVFFEKGALPEKATISDLTSATLDSIFLMFNKKFNFQKLLKAIDAKILCYKSKFDLSSFYF